MRALFILGSCCLLACSLAVAKTGNSDCPVRSIYLNGSDISGAIGQEMKKVTVYIGDNGDIYITAPHYQVSEEHSYLPVSRYLNGKSPDLPAHKKPGTISAERGTDSTVPTAVMTKESAVLPGAPLPSPGKAEDIPFSGEIPEAPSIPEKIGQPSGSEP